jgi:septum site-determining protein MinD
MMIYAILSGKGGVGKTTLAANLGILASKLGKKTLLVDADLAAGNLGFHFGLREPQNTIHELLAGGKEFKSSIHQVSEKLDILPSGVSIKGFLRADIGKLPAVLRKISKDYEVIILDAPPGISKGTLVPLKCAEQTVIVTSPELPSIMSTMKVKAIVSMLDKSIAGLVVNRVRSSFFGRRDRPSEIAKQIGIELLGAIPEGQEVRESLEAGRPIVLMKPKSAVSKALREISVRLFAKKR